MNSESIPYRLGSAYAVPLMLFFTAVLLFIALLQRQRELTALCLVTIGIMAVAYFWSRASLRGTEFELAIGRSRLFPGEQLQITLDVLNAKALPIHVTVSAGFSKPFGESQTDAAPGQSSGLLGYQRAAFHWHLSVSRRGVHSVGPLDLTSGDPFGFFPRHTQIPAHHEIVVYPRLVPIKPTAFSRREAFGAPGAQSHVRDPVLIQGTREYKASEPARHIHWKASARHNRLQTKVFASSYQEKSMLLLDVSGFDRQQGDADFERLLEVIASIAEQKDRQGSATGLLTNSVLQGSWTGVLPPARNPCQISMIMETLARCTTAAGADLLTQLSRSIQIPWGTSCAVFTLEKCSGVQRVISFLRRRRLPVRVFSCKEALELHKQTSWVDAGEESTGEGGTANAA